MRRTVHLAGGGLCCAAGRSPEAVVDFLASGQSRCVDLAIGERRFPYAALADDWPLADGDWLARAERAVHDCMLPIGRLAADTPLFFASSSFEIGQIEQQGAPFALLQQPASFAATVAGWLGLRGARHSFSSACVSGHAALQAASELIANGEIDDVLVIGCELFNRLTPAGFAGMELLSAQAARPFDAERDGLVLGEAVAALHLSARPATWRLLAVDSGLDGFSPTGPTPDGSRIAALIGDCLGDAGLAAGEIDLVKLHAAGSPGSDPAEARALRTVFGDALPPLWSAKGALGHTLGASSIVETVALLGCLDAGFVPATVGFARPDPEIGRQPNVDRMALQPRRILCNALGFGGGLGAMILERNA